MYNPKQLRKLKKCVVCGKEYKPTGINQKYCSPIRIKGGCAHLVVKKYRNKYSKTPKALAYRRKYYKEYWKTHPRILKDGGWDYNRPKSRYRSYKQSAKRRKLKLELSFEQFMSYWQKPCHYCGYSIKTIGLDRTDNTKGYSINNVVPCCSVCNKMKGKLTTEQFMDQCKKIIN